MIHAAGASGRAAFLPLDETTPRQLEAHLRVKALGLAVLDDLAPSGLDFKVALGSLSTELGGVGLFAYAAGNHLLDAVAARTDWVCVDWDGWLPPDQGGRIGPEVPAIRVEEGRRTFGRILALAGIPRVLVSTLDLDRRRAEVERFVHQAARSRMARPGEVHPRPELENEYLAPRDELETALAGIWQKVFGLDRVGVEDNFFRLGGDSLMAIQLKAQLWETLAVDLAVDELFEDPTVAGLARKVEAALQDQEALRETLDMVEGLSDEEVEQMLAELEE
jgi:acyl carrier protein